jgi:hypothetical protein
MQAFLRLYSHARYHRLANEISQKDHGGEAHLHLQTRSPHHLNLKATQQLTTLNSHLNVEVRDRTIKTLT